MGHYHGRNKIYSRQYKKSQTNPPQSMLANLGRGLYRLLNLPSRKFGNTDSLKIYHLNKESLREQWLEVESLVKLGKPSNFQKALILADKLIDHALENLNYPGDTLAERLRAARSRFSDYQGIWWAHKLRNQVVHDLNKEALSFEVKKALIYYQKALQDLKIL